MTGQLVTQLADAIERPDPASRLQGVLDAIDSVRMWGTAARSALAYAVAATVQEQRRWPAAHGHRDFPVHARQLALRAVNSPQYLREPEYKEAVDAVLAFTQSQLAGSST